MPGFKRLRKNDEIKLYSSFNPQIVRGCKKDAVNDRRSTKNEGVRQKKLRVFHGNDQETTQNDCVYCQVP